MKKQAESVEARIGAQKYFLMLIRWHYDFTPVLKVLLGASFFFSLLKDSQINATVAIEMEQTKKRKPEIHCDFLAFVHTRQNTY